MQFVSTRGIGPVSFWDAALGGVAADGGLYVPQILPARLVEERHSDFASLVAEILHRFAPEDLSRAQIYAAAQRAFAHSDQAFSHPAVAPLSQIDANSWFLELFQGPSLAFKDFALRMIAEIWQIGLARGSRRVTALVATSGDTGGAAALALANRPDMRLFVLHPKGRITDIQRRFMTSLDAGNVHNIEVEGDFDLCQAMVKAAFQDRDFVAEMDLVAVNSINWLRISVQCAFYYWSALGLGWDPQSEKGGKDQGPLLDFIVPSGNFGNCLAGLVAKKCGGPVGQLHIACNANDFLARLLATGQMRTALSVATLAPAMDIQVPSNLERALYWAGKDDPRLIKSLMSDFADQGSVRLPSALFAALNTQMHATRVDDARISEKLAWARASLDSAICPHSAAGLAALLEPGTTNADQAKIRGRPKVVFATAHGAKFPEILLQATGHIRELPDKARWVTERPEAFTTIKTDGAQMPGTTALAHYVAQLQRIMRA